LACLLALAPHVRRGLELWLWIRSASRTDQLIVHPETHLVAVKTVGDRNVLNITAPELAMHFKKRTATGHLFGPLQFAVTLGLFHVAKRQRLGCLRRCYNGLLIRFQWISMDGEPELPRKHTAVWTGESDLINGGGNVLSANFFHVFLRRRGPLLRAEDSNPI